jgi:hypothetical protein
MIKNQGSHSIHIYVLFFLSFRQGISLSLILNIMQYEKINMGKFYGNFVIIRLLKRYAGYTKCASHKLVLTEPEQFF